METAGFIALAGLFINAMEIYQRIRVGQHFTQDFEIEQTRLDLSKIQLSRWGEALGLNDDLLTPTKTPIDTASTQQINEAKKVLEVITSLLEEAHKKSLKFQPKVAHVKATSSGQNIHEKFQAVVTSRQPKSRPGFKIMATWALYGQEELSRLVDHISNLTNQLVTFFPATKPCQQELAKAELNELNPESLNFIKKMSDNHDKILDKALEDALKPHGHTYLHPHAKDGATQQNGDSIQTGYYGDTGPLSHTYIKPLAEGHGTRMHNGNVYGSKPSPPKDTKKSHSPH